MTQLALLTAITLVLAYTPIGYLPLGPFNVSFLSVPVCIGRDRDGTGRGRVPWAGVRPDELWQRAFGRFGDGGGPAVGQPCGYFMQSVVGRVLMGACVGLIFRAVRKLDKRGIWSYAVGAVCAPLLNTVFYMGLMCLIFYNCEYVQNLVASTARPTRSCSCWR